MGLSFFWTRLILACELEIRGYVLSFPYFFAPLADLFAR